MKRRNKKPREPGVIRKVISVLYEDAKRRRALRILERQAWGIEFLSMALVKAGKHLGEGIVLAIASKDGEKIVLSYDDALRSAGAADDSVFMHLNDELALDRFIMENSRR